MKVVRLEMPDTARLVAQSLAQLWVIHPKLAADPVDKAHNRLCSSLCFSLSVPWWRRGRLGGCDPSVEGSSFAKIRLILQFGRGRCVPNS